MNGGYVLDFSNRTFQEFIHETTGRNIYDEKYLTASGSKANRLRAFWSEEPNYLVGKVVAGMVEYARSITVGSEGSQEFEEGRRIAERLMQGGAVPEIEAIAPDLGGRDFEMLAKSVRECIDRNEPETGLDRLHTFVVKYTRSLCEKRGIKTDREKPLHSLFGEYVKTLRRDGVIESEMTERILKSSISTLEAFNEVRNERTLAHDNPILNYEESLLIFNHVTSSIRFLRALEGRTGPAEEEPTFSDEDIPF